MKKLIVFAVFGLMVMALSTTVYAQKLDFKASGNIWIFSEWWRWNSRASTESSGLFQVTPTNEKPAVPSADLKTSPTTATSAAAFIPPTGGSNPTQGQRFNKQAAYWAQRMRLKFDAVMGKSLSGTVFFEMDSDVWGDVDKGKTLPTETRWASGQWTEPP